MEARASVDKLERRRRRLAAKLARLGPILQGTITQRSIKGDRNHKQDPGRTYGPYYQWTFKLEGKTVTVNLGPGQVKDFQKAIERNREVELILKEMRLISEQILDAQTQGVKRRKAEK